MLMNVYVFKNVVKSGVTRIMQNSPKGGVNDHSHGKNRLITRQLMSIPVIG